MTRLSRPGLGACFVLAVAFLTITCRGQGSYPEMTCLSSVCMINCTTDNACMDKTFVVSGETEVDMLCEGIESCRNVTLTVSGVTTFDLSCVSPSITLETAHTCRDMIIDVSGTGSETSSALLVFEGYGVFRDSMLALSSLDNADIQCLHNATCHSLVLDISQMTTASPTSRIDLRCAMHETCRYADVIARDLDIAEFYINCGAGSYLHYSCGNAVFHFAQNSVVAFLNVRCYYWNSCHWATFTMTGMNGVLETTGSRLMRLDVLCFISWACDSAVFDMRALTSDAPVSIDCDYHSSCIRATYLLHGARSVAISCDNLSHDLVCTDTVWSIWHVATTVAIECRSGGGGRGCQNGYFELRNISYAASADDMVSNGITVTCVDPAHGFATSDTGDACSSTVWNISGVAGMNGLALTCDSDSSRLQEACHLSEWYVSDLIGDVSLRCVGSESCLFQTWLFDNGGGSGGGGYPDSFTLDCASTSTCTNLGDMTIGAREQIRLICSGINGCWNTRFTTDATDTTPGAVYIASDTSSDADDAGGGNLTFVLECNAVDSCESADVILAGLASFEAVCSGFYSCLFANYEVSDMAYVRVTATGNEALNNASVVIDDVDDVHVDCATNHACSEMRLATTHVDNVTYVLRDGGVNPAVVAPFSNATMAHARNVSVACMTSLACANASFGLTDVGHFNFDCGVSDACVQIDLRLSDVRSGYVLDCSANNGTDSGSTCMGSSFRFEQLMDGLRVDCQLTGACADMVLTIVDAPFVEIDCRVAGACVNAVFVLRSVTNVTITCGNPTSSSTNQQPANADETTCGSASFQVTNAQSLHVNCIGAKACAGVDSEVVDVDKVEVVCDMDEACHEVSIDGSCAQQLSVEFRRVTSTPTSGVEILCPKRRTSRTTCLVHATSSTTYSKGALVDGGSLIVATRKAWSSTSSNGAPRITSAKSRKKAFLRVPLAVYLDDSSSRNACDKTKYRTDCLAVVDRNPDDSKQTYWVYSEECTNFTLSLYDPTSASIIGITCMFGGAFVLLGYLYPPPKASDVDEQRLATNQKGDEQRLEERTTRQRQQSMMAREKVRVRGRTVFTLASMSYVVTCVTLVCTAIPMLAFQQCMLAGKSDCDMGAFFELFCVINVCAFSLCLTLSEFYCLRSSKFARDVSLTTSSRSMSSIVVTRFIAVKSAMSDAIKSKKSKSTLISMKYAVQFMLVYLIVGLSGMNGTQDEGWHARKAQTLLFIFFGVDLLICVVLLLFPLLIALIVTLILWMFFSSFSPVLSAFLELTNAGEQNESVFQIVTDNQPLLRVWMDLIFIESMFGFVLMVCMIPGAMVTKVKAYKMFLQFLDYSTDVIVMVYWGIAGWYYWMGIQLFFCVSTIIIQYAWVHAELDTMWDHALIGIGMGRGWCAVKLWNTHPKRSPNPRWVHIEGRVSAMESFYESYPSLVFGVYLTLGSVVSGPLLISIFLTALTISLKTFIYGHFNIFKRKKLDWSCGGQEGGCFLPHRLNIWLSDLLLLAFTISDFFLRAMPFALLIAAFEGGNENEKIGTLFLMKFGLAFVVFVAAEACFLWYALYDEFRTAAFVVRYSLPAAISVNPYLFGCFEVRPLEKCMDFDRMLHVQMAHFCMCVPCYIYYMSVSQFADSVVTVNVLYILGALANLGISAVFRFAFVTIDQRRATSTTNVEYEEGLY